MAQVTERTEHTPDGQPVFWREAEPRLPGAPTLYVHGVPTSSDDWVDFLALTGGYAPDLRGFGRTTKRADGDFTMHGQAAFVEDFLTARGLDRVKLVVHDWGAAALLWAMREPERVERLVVINAVPFLPGYRWHRIARLWRTKVVGEIAMGATVKPVLRVVSRKASATPGPLPKRFIEQTAAHLDQGTQRAILQLYRAAPAHELAHVGERLSAITAPALVLWGSHDPWIPARFAHGYAAALGDARLELVDLAGHWPWLDRPEAVERVSDFLHGGA
ncbi:MAG TPA: alpha/beta hydrolase [Solirubrobacteraceae bacterium]|nr:alpha/beta hydrolase [Solirubrobacteraceae bacterium]